MTDPTPTATGTPVSTSSSTAVTGTATTATATSGTASTAAPGDPTLGRLVHDLTEQTRELMRGEMALARAELTDTVKHAGTGAGLFGGAGVIALYGLGALIAAAIAGLAVVLDVWLAALIVAVVLFVIAGIAALLGKKQVTQATPAVPATQQSVQRDVATLKEGTHRE